MKTIREWFNCIENENLRARAFKESTALDLEVDSLAEAFRMGIENWDSEYWLEIISQASYNEYKFICKKKLMFSVYREGNQYVLEGNISIPKIKSILNSMIKKLND